MFIIIKLTHKLESYSIHKVFEKHIIFIKKKKVMIVTHSLLHTHHTYTVT